MDNGDIELVVARSEARVARRIAELEVRINKLEEDMAKATRRHGELNGRVMAQRDRITGAVNRHDQLRSILSDAVGRIGKLEAGRLNEPEPVMADETTGKRLVREAHEKLPPEVRSSFVHICNVHATHLADAIDAAIAGAEARVSHDVSKEVRAAIVSAANEAEARAEKAERERDEAERQRSNYRYRLGVWLGWFANAWKEYRETYEPTGARWDRLSQLETRAREVLVELGDMGG